MSSPGHLIFISSNTTTGGDFLVKARQMGNEPLLLCRDPDRFPFVRDLAVNVAAVDETDDSAVQAFVEDFALKSHVSGVLTSSEYFLVSASRRARRLGLPSASPEALQLCRNKKLQRRRLAEAGVPQPQFHFASNEKQAAEAFLKLSGRAVVKPVDGSGSVGVRLVADDKEMESAVCALLGRVTNERGVAIERGVLIEEFVRGPEFSIEIFGGKVVGVTRKLLGQQPVFVEVGHTYPAPLRDNDRQLLEKAATDAVRALGLTWGPAHVEAKLAKHAAIIIEVNARLAGGFIPRLIELTGTDLISATIAAATGAAPLTPESKFAAAALRFIVPGSGGVITGLSGIGDARSVPGFQEFRTYRRIGETVRLHGDFRDRIGHVIATGSSPENAEANADAAIGEIGVAAGNFG